MKNLLFLRNPDAVASGPPSVARITKFLEFCNSLESRGNNTYGQGFSKDVVSKFDQVDILVNNVGGNKRNLFEKTSIQDWQEIMDLNLLSHVKVTQSFLPMIKKHLEKLEDLDSIIAVLALVAKYATVALAKTFTNGDEVKLRMCCTIDRTFKLAFSLSVD